jgi:flagellar motor switch protein FliN
MPTAVQANLDQILKLDVPIVVRLGEKDMNVGSVLGLVPGSIIELPKNAQSELDLLVNNKAMGCGVAVKVGENFGIRLTFLGDIRSRIDAMGGGPGTRLSASATALEGLGEALGG